MSCLRVDFVLGCRTNQAWEFSPFKPVIANASIVRFSICAVAISRSSHLGGNLGGIERSGYIGMQCSVADPT